MNLPAHGVWEGIRHGRGGDLLSVLSPASRVPGSPPEAAGRRGSSLRVPLFAHRVRSLVITRAGYLVPRTGIPEPAPVPSQTRVHRQRLLRGFLLEVEPGRRAKPKRRPGLLLALNHLAQLGPLHGGFHRRQRVLARGPASLGLGRGGIWILRRRGRGRTPAGQLGLAQRLRVLKRVAVLRGSLLKVGAVLRVSHRRFP